MTFLDEAGVGRPVTVAGATVLETASPAVWFTFPGAWHDIGRFHLPDGRFTGLYANVLTPVRIEGDTWHTTDLCLDVFMTPAGDVHVLDRDELERAEAAGWIGSGMGARAREEAADLVRRARAGTWPPPVVSQWTLERARAAAAGTPAARSVYRGRRTQEPEGGR